MLAAIKMEVMTPFIESPDEGCIAIDFHMPPICSPIVRPGRPAEAAPVISKQLSDTISSSGMIDLRELSIVKGKAAWMAYLDVYCLDADGSLFDAALLSAAAAFSHLRIPVVALNDDGKVIFVSEEEGGENFEKEPVNKERRKLKLNSIPFSLTCLLHKKYILADPTAEEESVMETIVTVVLDSSGQLVSFYKPGGSVLAYTSAVQGCLLCLWLFYYHSRVLLDWYALAQGLSKLFQARSLHRFPDSWPCSLPQHCFWQRYLVFCFSM
ncbi:exosome complex component RRP43 isoform X4 [Benincasa hispida]|nr:exosome complex component RRP43 isoform X4 [Benincasa hispida]